MSSDESSENGAMHKYVNEMSLASGYKRMIYGILIVILILLILTIVLRRISG